jgi:hypothetical protein
MESIRTNEFKNNYFIAEHLKKTALAKISLNIRSTYLELMNSSVSKSLNLGIEIYIEISS